MPAQLANTDGAVLVAAARCITNQTVMGLAFAVMFHRTRSVIASSVFHVLFNRASTSATASERIRARRRVARRHPWSGDMKR